MPLEWQYSRNRLRHWVPDGEMYEVRGNFWDLFEIKECRKDPWIHRPGEGYDLYHRGKKVAHAKTVKELKLKAEELR